MSYGSVFLKGLFSGRVMVVTGTGPGPRALTAPAPSAHAQEDAREFPGGMIGVESMEITKELASRQLGL